MRDLFKKRSTTSETIVFVAGAHLVFLGGGFHNPLVSWPGIRTKSVASAGRVDVRSWCLIGVSFNSE